MTLEALLEKYAVTEAEFLKVDVEGSEVGICTFSAIAPGSLSYRTVPKPGQVAHGDRKWPPRSWS